MSNLIANRPMIEGRAQFHGVTVLDLLTADLLTAGQQIEMRYKCGQVFHGTVELDGLINVNGQMCTSPSSAMKAACPTRGGIVNDLELVDSPPAVCY